MTSRLYPRFGLCLALVLTGVCAFHPVNALSQPLTESKEKIMTTPAPTQDPVFVIKTSLGEMTVRLYATKAPITVDNFRKYVTEGFYNGTIFHRVIDGFMIQGGGFTPNMAQKPTHEQIVSEASKDVPNKRGTLAMARTSNPHSATSQFFINVQDNAFLNRTRTTGEPDGYTVFGEVIKGLDVLDAIRKVPTTSKAGHENVPVTPVIIESIVEQKAQ